MPKDPRPGLQPNTGVGPAPRPKKRLHAGHTGLGTPTPPPLSAPPHPPLGSSLNYPQRQMEMGILGLGRRLGDGSQLAAGQASPIMWCHLCGGRWVGFRCQGDGGRSGILSLQRHSEWRESIARSVTSQTHRFWKSITGAMGQPNHATPVRRAFRLRVSQTCLTRFICFKISQVIADNAKGCQSSTVWE